MRSIQCLLAICFLTQAAHADNWSLKAAENFDSWSKKPAASYPSSFATSVTINQLLQTMQSQAESTSTTSSGLEILSAYCGANGSWRDVTSILRGSIRNNSLQVDWKQPYSQIGGDPAFGKIKLLLIAFRLNGKNRIAVSQEENPPIGLVLTIP